MTIPITGGGVLDVSLAGTDKANGANRFDDGPIFSNNQKWKSQMLGDPDLKPVWGIWDEVEI